MKLNPTHAISCCIFAVVLMAANSQPKLEYSPYQILVWELKANEGYRSWWYEDGYGRKGQRAYSIGFGWNDLGQVRRSEIKEFTKNGHVSFEEATTITVREIGKYGKLHNDPFRNVALQLYSYNCGITRSGSKLGKCCGAKWMCGNPSKNIRKSHTRRRKMELALWNHDFRFIESETAENRAKICKVIHNLNQ